MQSEINPNLAPFVCGPFRLSAIPKKPSLPADAGKRWRRFAVGLVAAWLKGLPLGAA